MAIIDRVRELVGPVVADSGADLYDVEFNGGILRILISREGGIDIDTIKTISRSASRVLDDTDPVPGRYTLEVSSPGLERPLRTADHYRGAEGELIKIKTFHDVDGNRRFTGVVENVDEEGFVLSVDNTSHRFSYDQISKARTVFEWGPAPKPGGKNSSKNRPKKEATPS